MMAETLTRVCRSDHAWGEWHISGHELNAWVDAISLATSVVLERFGTVLEDVCWLRPKNNAQHIILVELDATIKGLNLALQWQAKVVNLYAGSLYVYHWLSNTLTGKARVRSKAASEMLVRRRLVMVKRLVDEYSLQIDITLVQSEQNLAD